MKRLVVITFN